MGADKQRWRQTGRKSGASFIQIPHFVMESQEFGAIEPFALKLLMELARQYKGTNNGNLSATSEMLKHRYHSWQSKDTLSKRLKWLELYGWVIKTRQGGRHSGCNLYAITWWPVDPCDGIHQQPSEAKASHAWKNANGGPPHGERKTATRGAKPFGVRRTGIKPTNNQGVITR